MAESFTPLTLANINGQVSSAVTSINQNFATLQTLLLDVVSLNGSQPNSMKSNLDMNQFTILNLPYATAASEPVTLAQLQFLTNTLTTPAAPTFASIFLNTEPSLAYTFASVATLNAALINVPGSNNGAAEAAATIVMNSTQGNANPLSFYKNGLNVLSSGTGNTGSVWGANIVAGLSSLTGANTAGIIGLEVDVNNAGGHSYTGTIGNPYGAGIYISGTGSTLYAGLIVDGPSSLWNHGIHVNAGAILSAYYDKSSATASYIDAGAHTTGISLTGTYTNAISVTGTVGTFVFSSPGFNIDSAGDVRGNVLTSTNSVATQPAVAMPAGGSAGLPMITATTTASFGIYFGSGVPTLSVAQGSLYLRSDGSSGTTRMYVNNSAGSGTTWTAVNTVA